jgi:phage baseplate assembly protein gpV
MFILHNELENLQQRAMSAYEKNGAMPRYGIVTDNKDPDCLGRLRVSCDTIAPGAVTGWLPFIHVGITKDAGWWQLPDIGTQVLLLFLENDLSCPAVFGCIHDKEHPAPDPDTEKPCDSIVYQSKKHRLEIIDGQGKETVVLSSADGKIRLSLKKGGGIELVNELGDIELKCRKLTVEGDTVNFQAKNGFSIKGGDAVNFSARKKVSLDAGKEVTVKGKTVKLNTSTGVTTEGRQLAAEGDKVMGFDIHQMEIPAGFSTAVVPLPHPFIGKLVDKLADKVTLNGHKAAVKGSKCKHDDTMHMQLPGTIRFVNNPNKEGEVTAGTGTKVKIEGKEAAVIGSMVTTCNDMGLRNNSAILAVGVSIPMPVIINQKNRDEYKGKERQEAEKKKPEFTSVKWGKGSAGAGEEIQLTAQVKDIADGNMVTFQIWQTGQNPASDIALAQVPASIADGAAKSVWLAPRQNQSYFFTAHSAWCPMKQSGSLRVKAR